MKSPWPWPQGHPRGGDGADKNFRPISTIMPNMNEIHRRIFKICICISSYVGGIMSCKVRKNTFWYVRPTLTQISLHICAVWTESSFSAWRNFASLAVQKCTSEDSDQRVEMPRLIWIFTGQTGLKILFFLTMWITLLTLVLLNPDKSCIC